MLAEKLSPTAVLSTLCEMPLGVVAALLFGSGAAHRPRMESSTEADDRRRGDEAVTGPAKAALTGASEQARAEIEAKSIERAYHQRQAKNG
ncbi:hypothetical protein EB232_14060 [Mesorhizobium sp. NZP2077]|nr:hypothetical protein EB232_14060 [Mesorhizobium sp. NZP2077]